jgi:hypothetical protein
MNFLMANVLFKTSMRDARSHIYKYSREVRDDKTRTVRAIFQNSYVNINHALGLLKLPDKIAPGLSRKDVYLILETAKAELKKYQRVGHYYVKWEWNWQSEHTIILILLVEIALQFYYAKK